eukprot:Blabericola_migrator_1__9991@NODE_552_length_7652_cov_40_220040_g145_i2_p1_GENE_NODE_552_length_7652_cov_40_220040_g145_i2NODE_552_length_7652_cov_40_220040_g145_i2_p1_ORF_typecomplete_len593_score41_94_NODE_552_length_7652_cov_40_220040_g145_i25722350
MTCTEDSSSVIDAYPEIVLRAMILKLEFPRLQFHPDFLHGIRTAFPLARRNWNIKVFIHHMHQFLSLRPVKDCVKLAINLHIREAIDGLVMDAADFFSEHGKSQRWIGLWSGSSNPSVSAALHFSAPCYFEEEQVVGEEKWPRWLPLPPPEPRPSPAPEKPLQTRSQVQDRPATRQSTRGTSAVSGRRPSVRRRRPPSSSSSTSPISSTPASRSFDSSSDSSASSYNVRSKGRRPLRGRSLYKDSSTESTSSSSTSSDNYVSARRRRGKEKSRTVIVGRHRDNSKDRRAKRDKRVRARRYEQQLSRRKISSDDSSLEVAYDSRSTRSRRRDRLNFFDLLATGPSGKLGRHLTTKEYHKMLFRQFTNDLLKETSREGSVKASRSHKGRKAALQSSESASVRGARRGRGGSRASKRRVLTPSSSFSRDSSSSTSERQRARSRQVSRRGSLPANSRRKRVDSRDYGSRVQSSRGRPQPKKVQPQTPPTSSQEVLSSSSSEVMKPRRAMSEASRPSTATSRERDIWRKTQGRSRTAYRFEQENDRRPPEVSDRTTYPVNKRLTQASIDNLVRDADLASVLRCHSAIEPPYRHRSFR